MVCIQHPGATRTLLWFAPDTLVLLGHPYGLHQTPWCY